MAKKQKIEVVKVSSLEAMRAVAADVVEAKLRAAELRAAMEQDILAVQRRYQDQLDELDRAAAAGEQGIFLFAQRNQDQLPAGRRTWDLAVAEVGWRMSPPAVEKVRSKDTWRDIAYRLVGCVAEGGCSFVGENYVRYADPAVDKERLIADRATLPPDELIAVGLRIVQEDVFSVRPKSDMAEDGPAVATKRTSTAEDGTRVEVRRRAAA